MSKTTSKLDKTETSTKDSKLNKNARCFVTRSQPLPNIPNIIQQNNANISKKPRSFEGIFDELMGRAQSEPIPQVIELCLQNLFESSHTILWIYLENQSSFFSPSFTIFAPTSGNLIAEAFKSRVPISIDQPISHPSYSYQIDSRVIPPTQPIIMIPIINRYNKPLGVLQFSRKPEKYFTQQEYQIASSLISKFQIYSGFLFPDPQMQHAAADVTQFGTLPSVIKYICNSISKIFRCRKTDIWFFDQQEKIVLKYDNDNELSEYIDPDKCGCAGYAAIYGQLINVHSILDHPGYSEFADGYHDETVLINPCRVSSTKVWAIALRGRGNPSFFSKSDEALLRTITPFVISSISCAVLPSTVEAHLNEYQKRLAALLEVAESLSGVLDLEHLIPLIMDRSCQLLNAERCSLFLVDPIKKELVTRFAGGLSNSIRLPIGKGIVGTTATTGEVINIIDAYADERFDSSVDKKTGFHTKSILAVPIYNNRGEIAGVTEMINRKDGTFFNDDDIKLMVGFNVFCGISLDNAKLYSASLNLASQLRTFVDISTQLNQTSTIKASIENILENARQIVNATRATLYLHNRTTDVSSSKTNDDNEPIEKLTLLVSVGNTVKYDTKYALQALEKKEIMMFTVPTEDSAGEQRSEVIKRYISNTLSKDTLEWRIKKDSMQMSEEDLTSNSIQICDIPFFNSEGQLTGIMELASNQKIMSEDLKLLESFAIFSAVSIERSQLRDITTLGEQENEILRYISIDERSQFDQIPEKLRLTEEKKRHIYTIYFDSPQWDGIGHIRVLFSFFHRFHIQTEYKISNEKLFRFFCEIRDTYNPVPYHNWRHAVDVTQFVVYQILTGHYDNVLTQFEIFALIVSAICHDANHDGFTNVFNVKAETPLGILFKNQSVMETHHCSVSIDVITKPQCNLFEELSPADFKKIWATIIQLILSTDMAKHFEILKSFNELRVGEKFTMDDPECRILLMEILLKCADISNVSRPFQLADKWCDVLCEEFFRQGDLELASGMQYTSPNNDREHLDKPKSQIGFYSFVCLPLFEAAAEAIPALQVNVKQVQSNLVIWKKEAEEEAIREEAEKNENQDEH